MLGKTKFLNTRYFSPVAIEGITMAPKGSYEYITWYEEQRRRCYEGYTHGGVTITGNHYYYLNFWKIRAKGKDPGGSSTVRKGLFYPRFLDIDYEWFWEVENARRAGEDLMALKRRQGGYSYKIGCIGGYEFGFFPDSYTIIMAGEEKFAKKTFSDMKTGLNQLAGTAFYKNRMPNASDHIRAAYEVVINGQRQTLGYLSEARRITAADPQAAVGTSPSLAIYEEIGMFPGLIATKMYTDAAMMAEGKKTGMSILIGTGGEENTSIDEVEEMYFNPTRYGIRAYENIWEGEEPMDDIKGSQSKVGLFIPGYRYLVIDQDGNSLEEESKKVLLERRAKLAGNPSALLKEVTQFPMTPSEALMRPDGNEFPIHALKDRKIEILRFEKLRSKTRTVNLEWIIDSNGAVSGVKFYDDPLGQFRMTEAPYKDSTGKVPSGVYAAGTDSYDRDKVAETTSGSFGSCYIGKGFIDPSQSSYILKVCSYTGRPDTGEEFYEATAKMCVLYNAMNLIEYSNIRIMDWYQNNGFTKYLLERPDWLYANMPNSTVQNRYGVDPQAKPYIISALADFLARDRNVNISKLYDLEDISELIRYRKEMNSDRTIAMALVAVNLKSMEHTVLKKALAASKPRHFFEMPNFRVLSDGSIHQLESHGDSESVFLQVGESGMVP